MVDVAMEMNGLLYCSFCAKSQHEVCNLIAGPQVYICDECVQLCVDIINGLTDAEREYASWFEPQAAKARND